MLQKNLAQEEAVKTTEGSVIVVSCPGSGKTTTLVRRIKNIIDKGVNPQKILMITFANSAAKDMEDRYIKLYGSNPGVSFMTIHSLCFSILKYELGYSKESLISEHQKTEFFVSRLKNNIFVTDAWEMAKTVMTEMSVVRNNYIPLSQYEPNGCDKQLFVQLFNAYEAEKRNSGKIDFDDMLVKCEELLASNKDAREKWGSYFDYIQVDEYQDTNQIQKDIIYYLIARTGNLCVVGDDDQSIYGFRGADPSIMMNFKNDRLNVKEIDMSTNYRSAQMIVNYADALIRRNKVRFKKDFVSHRGQVGHEGKVEFLNSKGKVAEMNLIIDKIQYLHEVEDVDYSDMAILFRVNKLVNTPVDMLTKSGIPFSTTERISSIYDSYIFKDIKSYVELSCGVNISANLYTVLNHPNRYLRYEDFKSRPFKKDEFLSAISYLQKSRDTWRYPAAVKGIESWFENFGPGKISMSSNPLQIFNALEKKNGINYLKHLKSVSDMKNGALEDEIELFNSLKEDAIKHTTIESWFKHAQRTVFKIQEMNRKRSDKGVKLTTMHKSKGLEWKVVFLIGVDQEVIPGNLNMLPKAIEEERRLLYVAMTRAEDVLFVSSSGKPSVFIPELIADYQQIASPVIKKKLPGAKVKHISYGLGKVVKYSEDAIVINFEGVGMKKLLFPDAFQKKICVYL